MSSTRGRTITFKTPARFVDTVPPVFVTDDKPCREPVRGKGKGLLRRGCHVELVFKPKPYLRFCFKAKEQGLLVPVDNPRQAQQFSQEICACGGKDEAKLRACITKRGGREVSLGKVRQRRRRRRR